MSTQKSCSLFLPLLLIAGLYTKKICAHPGGNLIAVGEHVYWSYIHPIDASQHPGALMHWTPGIEPEVLLQSDYPVSDFFLSHQGDQIHIIERRYEGASDEYWMRVLKMKAGGKPEVIWDWQKDGLRIGEAGFIFLNDEELVFCRYPNLYHLCKGKEPEWVMEGSNPIIRMRPLPGFQYLLLGEQTVRRVDQKGQTLQSWTDLLEKSVSDAPLNRNQLFDMDYQEGRLLLAYWGQRSFIEIDADGERKVLVQQEDPFVPHWVAFWKEERLLFSSRLVFDGSNPRPMLMRMEHHKKAEVLWEK